MGAEKDETDDHYPEAMAAGPKLVAARERAVIVIGVDGSPESAAALSWCLHSLIREDDEILLVHVLKPVKHIATPNGLVPASRLEGSIVAEALSNQQRQAEVLLDQAALDCKLLGYSAEKILRREDDRRTALLSLVRHYKATDLVLGTGGGQGKHTSRGYSEALTVFLANSVPRSCQVHLVHKTSRNHADVSTPRSLADVSTPTARPISPPRKGKPQVVFTRKREENPKIEAESEAAILTKLQSARPMILLRSNSRKARPSGPVEKPQEEPAVKTGEASGTTKRLVPAGLPEETQKIACPPKPDNIPLSQTDWEAIQEFLNDPKFRLFLPEDLAQAASNYDESRLIHDGRVSRVYRGKVDGENVTISVMKQRNFRGGPEFIRAVKNLSIKESPQLLKIIGCCGLSGCVVKEAPKGQTLRVWLNGDEDGLILSVPARFRIAGEIAEGLSALHKEPAVVLHQELRPGTIIIDSEFSVKLGDAGMANLAGSMTLADMALAAPIPMDVLPYMDPEFTCTGNLTQASDIYALGVTLLQILTDKPPLGLKNIVATALRDERLQEVLDTRAGEWPLEETTEVARMAIRCLELRRCDRPSLDDEVLPLLTSLSERVNAPDEKIDPKTGPPVQKSQEQARGFRDKFEVNPLVSKAELTA